MADLVHTYRGKTSAREDRWYLALALIDRIRSQDHHWRQEMADVAQRVNAEWVIPLKDVAGEPTFPSIAAQLLSDSIDTRAQRANDTLPSIAVPAMMDADTARDRANLRRRAWYAHYHDSQLELRLARAYRHYFGYDTFCLKVGPDLKAGRAAVSTANPLHTYVEPMDTDEIRLPHYIGWLYGRTRAQILASYPEAEYPDVHAHMARHCSRDESADVWDVMYWCDDGMACGEPMILMGLVGMRPRDDLYQFGGAPHVDSAFLLDASPNRAGIVPAISPKGPTLDKPISDMMRTKPIVDLLNKAFALDFIASEKAVFPDRYVVGSPGQAPKIVGGRWHDGRTGMTNMLENVSTIGELQSQPGPLTQALIANLERNARNSSGNPALMQGEPSGSLRSGNTVNAIASMSIDPGLKEAQKVMAYALATMNVAIAEVEKAYFGAKVISMFSGWPGSKGTVKYTPNDIWEESVDSTVTYPMPGMDAQGATLALGQGVQAGMISQKTARTKHPLVDDAEFEEAEITYEQVMMMLSQSAMQQVAQGQMALTDMILVAEKVKGGKGMLEAMAEVQKEAQERQAAQAPPEDPAAAMPGINDPMAGGQMQEGAGPPPPPAAALEQMVAALQQSPEGGASVPARTPA